MIHQDKITTINKYTQNIDTSSFIKQTLLDIKAQTNPNTIIVCDFNAYQHVGHPEKKIKK
jgi:hypothetical protein